MKGSDGQVAGGLLGLLLLASERVGRLPWLTGSTLGVSRSLGAGWLAAWLPGWGLVLLLPAPSPYTLLFRSTWNGGTDGRGCTLAHENWGAKAPPKGLGESE